MIIACAVGLIALGAVTGILAYQVHQLKQESDLMMTILMSLIDDKTTETEFGKVYDIKFPNSEGF